MPGEYYRLYISTLVNFFFFLPDVDSETNLLFNKREEVVKPVTWVTW